MVMSLFFALIWPLIITDRAIASEEAIECCKDSCKYFGQFYDQDECIKDCEESEGNLNKFMEKCLQHGLKAFFVNEIEDVFFGLHEHFRCQHFIGPWSLQRDFEL